MKRVIVGLTILLVSGCDREPEEAKLPEDFARYAALPALQSSHHPQLQSELARLISERATPQLLAQDQVTRAALPRVAILPDEENAAAGLQQIFTVKELESALSQLDRLLDDQLFPWDERRLNAASLVRRKHEAQRRLYRQALDRPACEFPIEHERGLLADLSFLDILTLGNRLEGVYAAECLAANQPDEAVEAVRYMLRAAELLAAEKHLATRVHAAELRRRALRVLEAICQHPQSSRRAQEALLDVLEDQLASWPHDAQAWIGDRAQGLHTYELIRDGYLLSLLQFDEIERLKADIQLVKRVEKLEETLDDDQLFYVDAMRSVIDSCQLPYYERQEILQHIRRDLEALRDSPRYPWIADKILLDQLEQTHELQALDRATVEAWALVLAVTTDRKPVVQRTNPLTGELWQVSQQQDHVLLENMALEDGRPIMAPVR